MMKEDEKFQTVYSDWWWKEEAMVLVEQEFDEHLNSLWEYLYASESDDAVDIEEPPTSTGWGFDGCDVCLRRETFAFLMPRFLDAYRNGLIGLQQVNKPGESDVDEGETRRDV